MKHSTKRDAAPGHRNSAIFALALSTFPLFAALMPSPALAETGQTSTYHYGYDGNGNLKQTTDPLNRVSDLRYDPLNRLQQLTMPPPVSGAARPTVGLTYDGQDNPATVTDPRGLKTTYLYGGLGDHRQLTSPDTNVSVKTYDAAGNLKTVKDARQKVTTYGYDALNRVTSVTFTAGTGITFEYDGGATPVTNAIGRVTKMTDESGSTTYVYNALGELASRTQTVSNGTAQRSLTVSYAIGTTGTSNGKLTSMTYPSGNRVNYGYDAAGRVNRITLNPTNANGTGTNTATGWILLADIAYAPTGAVQGWNWGNSTATSPNRYARTFDLDGRISSYSLGNTLTTGTLRTVRYDAAGRIRAYEHTGANAAANAQALNQSFGYDDLDRLTSFQGNSVSHTYEYDANGNRTKLSIGTASYTNTISPPRNRLTNTTGPLPAKTNQYDDAGNLINDGTASFTYSARGRMASATVGGYTVNYLYNGLDQRVLRSGGAANASTTFFYDEQGRLLGEYNFSTGRVVQEFVYLDDLPVAVLQQSRSGTTPNEVVATNTYYVYPDHINTPRIISRANDNKIVWRWDNGDPFGLIPPNDNPSGLGSFAFNLRMPGQHLDRDTNLFYNYFRDYDPQTGRYVQSDPIGLDGGINTYIYGFNNPARYVDPSGRYVPLIIEGVCAVGGCEAIGAILGAIAIKWGLIDSRKIGPIRSDSTDSCSSSDTNSEAEAKQDGRKIPNEDLKAAPDKRGNAPIGEDGYPVELHHNGQQQDSPLDEMTRTEHRGKGNFKNNYDNTGQRPSEIDRAKFNQERRDYWNKEWDSGRFKGF